MPNSDSTRDTGKSKDQLKEELPRARDEVEKIGRDRGEEIFLKAFNFAAIGMALVAPDGVWLKVNPSLCSLLGYSEEELRKISFQDITHPDDLDADYYHLSQLLSGTISSYQLEKRYFHKDGHIVNVLLSVSLVQDSDGTPRFYISQIQDISRRKHLEEELTRLATEDALTRVNNRRHFFEHAAREIARGERFHEPQALLMIDIDHFKQVNDRYGHDIGDEVLKTMAHCCKNTLRAVDVFARLGGEEFGALLINTELKKARMIAERIRENVELLVVQTEKGPVSFTVSIGLSAFFGGHKPLAERLKQADLALYSAKKAGRNRVEFSVDMSEPAPDRISPDFLNLVWKNEYECGNREIDSQHRELFQIANRLLSAMITRAPAPEIKKLVESLVATTTGHFHHEDAVCRSAGYPLCDEHSRIHATLTKQMNGIQEKFRKGKLSVGELFSFLAVDVLANHLLLEDRKHFPYLRKSEDAG